MREKRSFETAGSNSNLKMIYEIITANISLLLISNRDLYFSICDQQVTYRSPI
jgi:hypothetical protein